MAPDQRTRHPSPSRADEETDADARAVLEALGRRAWTVGTAESLTGGLLVATLVDVPGASASVRGGIVAYATDLKSTALGVDTALLDRVGAVDATVAAQMAQGARRALGTHVGIATTGVAGPSPQDGRPVGTVYIAVATPEGEYVSGFVFGGTRAEIRSRTVREALRACFARL
ncbi:CinA family protein [Microbacterium yannicii]|uniref:CinA family protein n=1 Tax=Microbacterium yannicii TaxID=671622 RepID=UPI0002E185F2|nr:CinA family protein [Microbacterium yannicii]